MPVSARQSRSASERHAGVSDKVPAALTGTATAKARIVKTLAYQVARDLWAAAAQTQQSVGGGHLEDGAGHDDGAR